MKLHPERKLELFDGLLEELIESTDPEYWIPKLKEIGFTLEEILRYLEENRYEDCADIVYKAFGTNYLEYEADLKYFNCEKY